MQKLIKKAKSFNKLLIRMNSKKYPKEQLKKKLTPLQYRVTQEKGTDRPFEGIYNSHFTKIGQYLCLICESPLFKAQTKYESSCGWPAFYEGLGDRIEEKVDGSHGLNRVEVLCKECGSHLGHVFKDGPKPTGVRYCINSSSIVYKE